MVRKTPQDDLDELLEIVAARPDGVAVPEIEKSLTDEIPRRTLQYRLKLLVDAGLLNREGSGRWAKYRSAPADAPSSTIPAAEVADYAELIGFSEKARAINDYVRQPLLSRKPVGYNWSFLEQYQPNTTFYLKEEDRERLERLGKSQTATQPAGTFAKHILNRLLIDLAWNSSRLEGNTYSLLDTKRLIEFGQEANGRDHIEAQMILNHKDAIEFLVGSVEEVGFNSYTLLNLHALLSNNLLADPAASGRLRYIAVGIEKSAFHPLEMPQRIEEGFNLLLAKAGEIENPFEQAFFVMVHLPYLQPFDDVNKRVSRLAANIPLIQHNLAPLSFTDVPQRAYTEAILGIYELNETALLKDIFLWAYERSAAQYAAIRQSLGEPDPFRLKYRSELKDVVATIIRGGAGRQEVGAAISRLSAELIPADDRAAFAAIVEDELLGLHEGNFARYQLRPSEFRAWQEVWTKS
ncbi:Fic family protein [Aliiruegeria sabulilitoris]|uniref:Fic family protein n=1 Tax=Aliiruegeria sabulilitoris TaxID=1510458 RepID=UPI00082E962C|nr:Fic family protein [Aliiruegeria sabulilitoris]NDR55441.1 hypothetical protein [Pseudoruegeria sp. M32A2M]